MDPDRLDEIVAAIPPGRWMSYGDVAHAAGGTDQHARALNQRFIRSATPGAHRVLKGDGRWAGPRSATRARSAAASSPRGSSSRAAAPTPRRACAVAREAGGAAHGAPGPRKAATVEPRPSALAARPERPALRTMAACSRGRRSQPVPYLVVGLARSGVAVGAGAARRAARRWRAATPGRSPPERRAELEAAASPVHAGTSTGSSCSPAPRTVVKSPGVPRRRRWSPRRATRGMPRGRRARARLAAGAERVDRGDGLQRQDDDGRADRPDPPRRRAAPVDVAGNVGTALSTLAGDGSPATATVVCEASSFQLEDTERFAPDAGGAAQPRRGPPRPPRHASTAYRAAKLAGLRPPARRHRGRRAGGVRRRRTARRRRERVWFGDRRAGAARRARRRAVVGRRAR